MNESTNKQYAIAIIFTFSQYLFRSYQVFSSSENYYVCIGDGQDPHDGGQSTHSRSASSYKCGSRLALTCAVPFFSF